MFLDLCPLKPSWILLRLGLDSKSVAVTPVIDKHMNHIPHPTSLTVPTHTEMLFRENRYCSLGTILLCARV